MRAERRRGPRSSTSVPGCHWPCAWSARVWAAAAAAAGLLAERLRDHHRRLDELKTGDLAVRSSLALSYGRPAAPARRALRLLRPARRAGRRDWPLGALSNAAAEGRALLDVLSTRTCSPSTARRTGAPRYRLHDLVRLYAANRAEPSTRGRRARPSTGRAAAWLVLPRSTDAALACRYLSRTAGPAPAVPPAAEVAERVAAARRVGSRRNGRTSSPSRASRRGGNGGLAWNLADSALGFYEMRDLRDDWSAGHHAALRAAGRPATARVRAVSRATSPTASRRPRVRRRGMRAYPRPRTSGFVAAGDTAGRPTR